MNKQRSTTRKFTLEEQETSFVIEATDRKIVRCYSNDPVFQNRLKRAGIEPTDEEADGGKFYRFPINQLRISKPPRQLTDAEREAATQRLREAASNSE